MVALFPCVNMHAKDDFLPTHNAKIYCDNSILDYYIKVNIFCLHGSHAWNYIKFSYILTTTLKQYCSKYVAINNKQRVKKINYQEINNIVINADKSSKFT